MALVEVSSRVDNIANYPNKPIPWGYYIGKKEVPGMGNSGVNYVYDFRGKDGVIRSIYGFGALNSSMDKVPFGAFTVIEYKGKITAKTKTGVRDINTCKVQFDPDDTLEESLIPKDTEPDIPPPPPPPPSTQPPSQDKVELPPSPPPPLPEDDDWPF